jgi:hypothetical protein
MQDEQQMSFFEEGGMTAPEVQTDPESGNDVPPGSLPEEVRDDVDAKLSTGEYVVPADVVRYFGMKFFEDLREAAKNDLEKMDSEGRIGGEPMDEQEGPQSELSEQEMALLQEVMSEGNGEPQFNQGGMVTPNPEGLTFSGGTPSFAEGGLAEQPTFNPAQWQTVGSSLSRPQGSGSGIGVGSYYKTYVGPNGETRLILFVNGEPSTPIPEGFTEQKDAASEFKEEQAKEETEDFTDSESDQRRREQEEERQEAQSWAERNYDAVTNDPVAFGMEQLQGDFTDRLGGLAPRAGMALLGPVGALGGAVASGAMQVQNLAAAKAAKLQAEAQGMDTSTLDAKIEEYESNLSGPAKAMTKFGAGTGEKYFESLREYTPGEATQTDEAIPTFSSTRGTGGGSSERPSTLAPATSTRPKARPDGEGGGSPGARGVGQETAAGNKAKAQTAARGAGVSAKTAAGLSGQQMSNPGGFDKDEGDWATGPMNKGGLVKRRKKKK